MTMETIQRIDNDRGASLPTHQHSFVWPSVSFVLITIGLGFPLARIILPGQLKAALFIPLLLLFVWFLWRLSQPRSLIISPLGLPLLLSALAISASGLAAVVTGSLHGTIVIPFLFHWGAICGVTTFLLADMLAAGWSPRTFVRVIVVLLTIALLHGSWTVVTWWLKWLSLWQPGDVFLPVPFRKWLIASNPNQAAMMVNFSLPLGIVAMWRAHVRWKQVVWGMWLAAAVIVLFYTTSRGGWLAMGVMVTTIMLPLIWSMMRAKQWKRLVGTVIVAGCYAALFLFLFVVHQNSFYAQYVTRGTMPSRNVHVDEAVKGISYVGAREMIWHYAVEMFTDHPIFGIGPNGFETQYRLYKSKYDPYVHMHAHNIYLGVLSELGLIGVFALVSLALTATWLWVVGLRRVAMQSDTWLWMLACGAVGVGIAVHGLVDIPSRSVGKMPLSIFPLALAGAGCWTWSVAKFTTTRTGSSSIEKGVHTDTQSSGVKRWFANVQVPHPLHIAIVVVAVAAWGMATYIQLKKPSLYVAPQDPVVEAVEHAMDLGQQAYENPELLPEALVAQEHILSHIPQDYIASVNYAALLAELGHITEAVQALESLLETDNVRIAEPYVMLARLHEQMGHTQDAHLYWQQALERNAMLAESVACLQSDICDDMPLPDPWSSALAAQVVARHYLDNPNEQALDEVSQIALAWNNVNIWAVNALLAQRVGDEHMQKRALFAAVDIQKNRRPTKQMAIALLYDAMDRNDTATLRELVQQQGKLALREEFVPQVGHLLVTTVDVELAQVTLKAAMILENDTLIRQARTYMGRVEALFLDNASE